ncbi:MAG: hypothetical protein V3V10_05115, partial [Planctomycetota bacterium]
SGSHSTRTCGNIDILTPQFRTPHPSQQTNSHPSTKSPLFRDDYLDGDLDYGIAARASVYQA